MENILKSSIPYRPLQFFDTLKVHDTLDDLPSFNPAIKRIRKIVESNGTAFIVGGYLRKLLRGKESQDIDIVTGGDMERLARAIADDMEGTIVNFKKAGIIRVVSGGVTIDLSRIQGSIYNDLSKRDFTINAIAWSPSEGLIDPFKGIDDIKRGVIRAISEDNLREDPLRLLRAYRFVAEEGFRIDPETRKMIKRLRRTISITAEERITSELFKILISPYYRRALLKAYQDGLLGEIIEIKRDRLLENIISLSRIDRFIESIEKIQLKEGFDLALNNEYSQGLSYRGLLRLERLLMNSNMDKNRLTLSRVIWKRLKAIKEAFRIYIKCVRQPHGGILPLAGSRYYRTLFDIFYELGEASIDFAILTGRRKIYLDALRFLRMRDIIPADRIAEAMGLKGKKIGEFLKELRYLQYFYTSDK